MTKKEIDTVMKRGCSHLMYIPEWPLGVTRFQVFLAIKPLLTGKLYWYALREAYDGCDNLFHYKANIQIAFTANEPERNELMKKEEQIFLKSLTDTITIYRGMTKKEKRSKGFGVSWSLKKETAEYFAYTYGRNYDTNHLPKTVHKLQVSKSEVVAYFNQRKEQEIIYIPKEVRDRWADIGKSAVQK